MQRVLAHLVRLAAPIDARPASAELEGQQAHSPPEPPERLTNQAAQSSLDSLQIDLHAGLRVLTLPRSIPVGRAFQVIPTGTGYAPSCWEEELRGEARMAATLTRDPRSTTSPD